MPVRARSASSISAMRCLPDRLMPRRSSSSGSTPSRTTPPSRATSRRFVEQRPIELLAQVREIVQLGEEARHERSLHLAEQHPHARHCRDRLAQRHEIARACRAERRAGDEPLDVVDRLQRLAHLRALGAAKGELFDRVEPVLDALEREQRPEQPAAQQPPPHRRDRAIDLVQQRSGAPAIDGLDHFEVPERGRIDQHAVRPGAERDLAHVRQVRLLGVAQVVHKRAGGARGGGVIFEAEAPQALRPQLRQQRPARRLELERPVVGCGHARRQPQLLDQLRRLVKPDRRHNLARLQHRELVQQRLPSHRRR